MVDISPDDTCEVCGTKRDEHGDRMHQFSMDGQLIELKPGPEGRKPPQTKEEAEAEQLKNLPNIGRAFATLVEVLAEKKINFDGVNRPLLDAKDIIRIFSGQG